MDVEERGGRPEALLLLAGAALEAVRRRGRLDHPVGGGRGGAVQDERSDRGARGGDVATAALIAASGVFAWGSGGEARRDALVSAPGLVPVFRIRAAMALFLLFGESVPLGFDVFPLVLPLVADDLGDFRVGKPRVVGDYLGLLVLSVEDEGWEKKGGGTGFIARSPGPGVSVGFKSVGG